MQGLMRAAALSLFLLTLIGCAQQIGPRQIPVAEGVRFDLLPPRSLSENRQHTEIAEIEFSNERHEVLLVSETTEAAITIVGLMPNGTRLFTMRYDGALIESDGDDRLLRRIRPAFFLADFQMSRWPFEMVRNRLAESNRCFQQDNCAFEEAGDNRSRRLTVAGRQVLEIAFEGIPHDQHGIRITHFDRNYRIALFPAD